VIESACADGFEFITVTPPDGFCRAVVFFVECLAKMGKGGLGRGVLF